MHITMVKKRLPSGEDCRKCAEAESMLKNRGLWDRIDTVVTAVEDDPNSEGFQLGVKHDVATTPFFIVRNGAPQATVYRSVLKFIREQAVKGAGDVRDPDAELRENLEETSRLYAERDPIDIVRWGLSLFGERCGIAFSGAEDVALIDLAAKTGLPFSVFCLDTGRLHAETYAFIDRVRKHYGIEISMMSPEAAKLEPFVRKKGLFSFLEDGHQECCSIRKVQPLRRALGGLDGWISGVRRDQSPATRADIPVIQDDAAFQGRGDRLVKLNPLANWSSQQTWAYIRENDVPFNPLHERGFKSIGCEPCTRPTHPGQHEREGRWWWEEQTAKECGLHSLAPAPSQG
jgi:phosphoadenosine phosphosulfate reductase